MSDQDRLVVALDELAHELRGSLGTIRFAITAMLDNPDNAKMRAELLATADAEAVHLVEEIAKVEVLAQQFRATDPS